MIGNKADLNETRVIKTEQGEKMKSDYGFDIFMETSAKTGFNAQELFVEAGKLLYDEYIKYKKGPAIGGEHLVKKKEKTIKLQIWDTCGQEIYRSLITSFYKNSSLAIIVYAIDE